MKVNKDLIHKILNRNVAEVIVKSELEKKLLSGKKLNIKFGIDPTGTNLHLGHMVLIKKLRDFQLAGHQIILLFGNFTAQIGDPTGKSETRKPLTKKQVEENAKTYLKQIEKVLDIKKVKVVWNNDWLGKLKFDQVIKLAANFTVAQLLERDMFQERIKNSLPIGLHEFMYPLLQGYDSVAIKADVELGGTDQMFNMLMARPLQKESKMSQQSIMTTKILVGTDGIKKMGKSENNFIAIFDSPKEKFGKIMSIPDSLIIDYFEMCTDYDDADLKKVKQRLQKGENPKHLKIELAKTIVTFYHNQEEANQQEEEFNNVFAKKGLPTDIPVIKIVNTKLPLIDLLAEHKLVKSKAEARRLIDGGGIKVDQNKIQDYNYSLNFKNEHLIQIGKRIFVKFKA